MAFANDKRRALLLSALCLALAAIGFAFRPQPGGNSIPALPDDSPAQCIVRLLAAEKAGDVRAYLDCFAAPLRDRLQAGWGDTPMNRTAGELQSSFAGMAGHALTDEKFTPPNQASLVLERIHKDHTVRQTITLRQEAGIWRVVELSDAEWQTPTVRYGTPVSGAP